MQLRWFFLGSSLLAIALSAPATSTPSPTPSASPTVTASASPTVTASASPTASATPEPRIRCFNIDQKILGPLEPEPKTFTKATKTPAPITEDVSDHGQRQREGFDFKIDYAWVSGRVDRPAREIFEALFNPRVIRDKDDTKIEVTDLPAGPHLKHQQQAIRIKPVFFLSISWTEDWIFSVLKGTPEAPKETLVSYEKIEGSSHIKHICGNVLIQSLTPKQSKVYIYEELNAAQRDSEDTLRGVKGTLANLRAGSVEIISREDSK
jgi:hypothetical protein